jgi:putative membrane protein
VEIESGQPGGDEPDYRFTLANERTFLAWIRTSLALLAAGVAVVQLLPDLGPRPYRLLLGLALIALSLLAAGSSYIRWVRADAAIRRGQPLTRPWLPAALAAGLSLVIVLTVISLLAADR